MRNLIQCLFFLASTTAIAAETPPKKSRSFDPVPVVAATPSPEPEPELEEELIRPKRHFAGALLGVASLSGGRGANTFYTARIGFGVIEGRDGILSLGAMIGGLRSKEASVGIQAEETDTVLAAELLGRRLFGTGLYLGGRVGGAFILVEVNAFGSTHEGTARSFAVGPVLGYELQMAESWGFALDVSHLSVGGGNLNMPTLGTIPYRSVRALLISGGVHVHY